MAHHAPGAVDELLPLMEKGAVLLARCPGFQQGQEIQYWVWKAKPFIIHVYTRGDGWELFIPAVESNRLDTTLAALMAYVQGEVTPTIRP